jgi:putative restriction endonuclease
VLARPALIGAAARALVLSNFHATVAPDVLEAVWLDPAAVLGANDRLVGTAGVPGGRRCDPRWRSAVLEAWDRQCAFCGYDGQITGASMAIEAAHVRWFAFDRPDALDNGLAPRALHHKLFDLGALGLDTGLRVMVSATFSARTPAGRAIYDLYGHQLAPRPGTALPAPVHVTWHTRQVFKGEPLAA